MLTPIQNSGPASHQPQLQQDEHFVVSCVRQKNVFFKKKNVCYRKKCYVKEKELYLALNVINNMMMSFLKDHYLV
jgi:hypothetical protein